MAQPKGKAASWPGRICITRLAYTTIMNADETFLYEPVFLIDLSRLW